MPAGAGLQEILTDFTFKFDKGKFSAIERGVKRSVTHLDTITKQTDVFQSRMGGFFARAKQVIGVYLGFRAVRTITTDYATAADAVAKFATATGLSTEKYQGIVHAAKIGGTDMENINKALTQLSKRALEAGQGLKTQQRAFQELGVEWNTAEGTLKGADQLFMEMSDGLVNLEDKEKRTGIAMQLLGRTGSTLLPTMLTGSKGIEEMIVQAKKLGVVLSKDQLKAAEDFKDEMLRVKAVLTGVRNTIAGKLLPVITAQLKAFQLWWREGRNAERAMRALKITAIFTAAVLARIVGAKVIAGMVSFVKGIVAGVRALRAMNFQLLIAQAKILLIVGAVLLFALVIEDLVGFAQGKDSVIGRLLGDTGQAKALKDAVVGIGKAAVQAWEDIKPAMLAAWTELKPAIAALWEALKPIAGPVFRAALWLVVAGFKGIAVAVNMSSNAIFIMTKAFKQMLKSVSFVLGPIKKLFDVVLGGARAALRAMGLLAGKPIKAESSIGAFVGQALTSGGKLRGTPGETVQGDLIHGTRPRSVGVVSPVTTNVAPNAVNVTVVTQAQDAKEVAVEVERVVEKKVNELFTDVSRDLVPAPSGQS